MWTVEDKLDSIKENIVIEDEKKPSAMQSPLSNFIIKDIKTTSNPQQWKKFQQCTMARYPKGGDRWNSLAMVKEVHTCWNHMYVIICQA